MKYLYTPYDIAVFFFAADFTKSIERAVLHDIWKNGNLPDKYRKDESLFRRHVYHDLSKFDGSLDDVDELNLLTRDTEHAFCIDGAVNEQGIVESYFKVIKLELTYLKGKDFRKIKLRSLLKQFGYKKRSAQLVAGIQHILDALELKTYLKGYVSCDIAEIDIDDTLMIRLKTGKEPEKPPEAGNVNVEQRNDTPCLMP